MSLIAGQARPTQFFLIKNLHRFGYGHTCGIRTDVHVRKAPGGSDGFGDLYVGSSGLGPNGLFFVVKGRVRKLFPLRSGSV